MIRRAFWPLTAVVTLAVAVLLFGYPTRTFLDQRASLGQEQAVVDRLASQNAALQNEASQLKTPAEIESLARQEYGLVEPGQEAYAILPSPRPSPPAGTQPDPAVGSSGTEPGGSLDAASTPARGPGGSDPGAAGKADPGGLWSRFVHQLEFWR